MTRAEVAAIVPVLLLSLNSYVCAQLVTWQVTDGGDDYTFTFSKDNMVQLYSDCLCKTTTARCQIFNRLNGGAALVGYDNLTQAEEESSLYSAMYECYQFSNSPWARCERMSLAACSSANSCWSYQIKNGPTSCELGQVGFTWRTSQGFTHGSYNSGQLTIIDPCSRSCTSQTTAGSPTTTSPQSTRSSTTTTTASTTTDRPRDTTTTTTITTTSSSTVKSTTTIASSSTSDMLTTTSTTGGGGSAPQKDDSSDDTGVIVGVVIAVLVVTAALIVGGIFWWRRRKNAEKSDRSLGNNVTVVHTSAFGITNHAFNRYEEGGTPDLLYAQVPADDPIGSRQNSAQYSNVQIKPMPNGKGPNHSYENVQRPVQPSSENNNHDNSNGVTPTPENPDEDQYLYPTNTEQSRSPPRFVITPKTDAQSDGMEYEDVSRFAEPDPGTAHTNIPSSATNNSNNNDNFYEIPIVPPNITNSASNPPNNLKGTNNSTAKPKSPNVYSEVDEIATSNSVDDIIPPQRTRFNVVPTSSTPEPANDVYELAEAIDTTDSLASTGKPQVAPKVARKPKGRKKKEDDKNNHVYFELESAASIRLDGPYSVEDKHEDDDDDEERYTENPYEDPDKQQSNDSQYSVI